jgi:hypothetical protein
MAMGNDDFFDRVTYWLRKGKPMDEAWALAEQEETNGCDIAQVSQQIDTNR